jgi:hypothetical protein
VIRLYAGLRGGDKKCIPNFDVGYFLVNVQLEVREEDRRITLKWILGQFSGQAFCTVTGLDISGLELFDFAAIDSEHTSGLPY